MLALAVEYLGGRAVTTSFDDREEAEWPPHPARLFFALAAAFFETGGTRAERQALEWLEAAGPPAIAAGEATRRRVQTSYVPVNDVKVPRLGDRAVRRQDLGVLPEHRARQPRTFPSVTPLPPRAIFVWTDAAPPDGVAAAISQLAAKVAYLGHSSSLVSVHVPDDPPPPTLVPAEEGDVVLRVPLPGQLAALEHAFEVFEQRGIRGRLPCGFQTYGRPSDGARAQEPATAFGDMIVFARRRGPHVPLTAAVRLTEALRDAAISHCDEPVPEALSGHAPDGSPSERPHVAFAPLPDVGHRHADGHLLGVAAVLPRRLAPGDRRPILRALGRIERLTLGQAGAWEIERADVSTPRATLRPETWSAPARRWVSVTPVVLDRFPKTPYDEEAEAIVSASCERIGLPAPSHVLAAPESIVLGVPPWHRFVPRERGGRPRRPLVHVVVDFAEPVRGPVLLGAGRYRGLGLCRPLR